MGRAPRLRPALGPAEASARGSSCWQRPSGGSARPRHVRDRPRRSSTRWAWTHSRPARRLSAQRA
eukprot:9144683-Alexandrium_andersonii.AAC.1